MNNYFCNTEKTGILTKEKVLFYGAYPICFTCRNNVQELFLCVCSYYESDKKIWLVSQVKSETIINMLEDKITLRDAFLYDRGKRYTISYENSDFKVIDESIELIDNWEERNEHLLPTIGEFMEAEEDEFTEEIEFYNQRRNKFNG